MLLGLSAAMAGAASRDDLLGTWYGESQDNGQLDGISFDNRRWTVVHTPDGTGMQIMRFYQGARFQIEIVMSFVWGVDNNVWWVECSTVRDARGLQDCSRIPRSDYRIDSLDSGGMRYTSLSAASATSCAGSRATSPSRDRRDQTSASTRVGPPVAPRILGAPTTSVAPRGGTRSRLATHSRPQRPVGSHA